MSVIRGVAQLGSALRSGRRGRRFKSFHPDVFCHLRHIRLVSHIQLVESFSQFILKSVICLKSISAVDNFGENDHTSPVCVTERKTTSRKLQIAVIGAGDPDKKTAELAKEVGRLIAERDGIVVCGGLGGVMEAVCRGAKSSGGLTVGLIPGSDSKQANEYVEVVIPTGFGEARNTLIIRSAEVVIALPGKSGTLSEIAFALIARKPVISLGDWKRDLPQEMSETLYEVQEAAEAVALAFELAS